MDLRASVRPLLAAALLLSCQKDDTPAPTPSGGGDGGASYPTVTDVEGNSYRTVQIGSRNWMAEDLRTRHYKDGTFIPNVTDMVIWASQNVGARCYYLNEPGNEDIYGMLYNWHVVNNARGICPEGWHVPSDQEWMDLEVLLGMPAVAAQETGDRGVDQGTGGKLKSLSLLWANPNSGATDETDFSALPGGYRASDGTFGGLGGVGYWWSASANGADEAWRRSLSASHAGVNREAQHKRYGSCVRCVQD